jgi:hypothetical protein
MNEETRSQDLPEAPNPIRWNRKNRLRRARGNPQLKIAPSQGNLSHWFFPLLFVLTVSLFLLFWYRPAELSLDQSLLGITIIGLGFVPLLIYLHELRRPPLPFLPMVGLYYAVSFGLPLFTGHLQEKQAILTYRVEDVSIASLWLTVGGMVSMFSCYLAGEQIFWRGISHVRIPWDGGSFKLRCFLWGCLVLHLSLNGLPVLSSIPSLGQFAGPAGFLGWGMILILGLFKRLSMVEKYLLVPAGLVAELLFLTTTGLLYTTINFGLFLAVVAFRYRPRLATVLAVLSLGFLIALTPVKNEFRQLTWAQGEQKNTSAVQRAELLFQLAQDYYFHAGSGVPSEDRSNVYGVLATRLSMINFLSLVVNMTPGTIPYWDGATYSSLLTKWIPRFLWPGKPQEVTGNDFGQRYKFLDAEDTSTSLNLPWIIELYANFGTWGILLGMGVFGLLLAFLSQLFNQPQMNPVEFVYGVSILFGLYYQESSFALMVGSVFLLSIALYVLLKQAYGGGIPRAKRMRRNYQAGVPPLS